MYLSNGPTVNGSLRKIDLIRNNKIIDSTGKIPKEEELKEIYFYERDKKTNETIIYTNTLVAENYGINGSFLLFVRHPLESQEKVSKNKKIYAAAFLKYLPWVSSTSGLLCTFYIVCVNCPLFVYTEHCSRALELGFVIEIAYSFCLRKRDIEGFSL